MAQNITLLGASYSAVPAVTLPKTGGGTASFTDVTDTTAAASDVASGKYFYTAAGVRTQGTNSGGGGSSWQILYDGSVQVYSSSPNYFQISPYTTAFQADQTYRVTWGQTQYICNTIADPMGATYDGWLIGNLSIVGAGADTGEPFIIYRNSATELTGGTSSSTGTYSLKIELQQSGINLQTKTKTYTPTTSQQTESVTADSGYDGLDTVSVTVNAMPSGTVTAPSTISGTSATVSTGTNTLTLSKTVSVTPTVSTAGYVSSGTAGNSSVSLTANVTTQAAQTIYPSTSDQSIASGRYLTGAQTIKAVTTSNLTADNIKSGVTVTVGDSANASRIASILGTYTGGGSSKNVQINQSTTRANSSSLTKVNGDLTVSKTGTYDIYWSAGRSNTSSSYTWGSRLYVDGSGYGTENTSWTNNCQSNHLTNVSLTANQKLSVYTRGRSGSYYTFAPMLVIIEA